MKIHVESENRTVGTTIRTDGHSVTERQVKLALRRIGDGGEYLRLAASGPSIPGTCVCIVDRMGIITGNIA